MSGLVDRIGGPGSADNKNHDRFKSDMTSFGFPYSPFFVPKNVNSKSFRSSLSSGSVNSRMLMTVLAITINSFIEPMTERLRDLANWTSSGLTAINFTTAFPKPSLFSWKGTVQLLLERIQRDTKLLGADGEKLDGSINRLLSKLGKARAADQQH